MTGWHDRCLDTIELFKAAQAGPPRSAPTELVVGPWSHGYARPRVVGDVDFGPAAESTFVDQAVDWFGRTLRDVRVDAGRRVRLFVMGANEWRSYERWPVPARTSTLYLGAGTLTASRPAESGSCAFTYDPRDPVPSTYSPDYQDAPIDQRILDGRQDIVRFETPPLTEPVEVIGSARLVLHASTDAPDTDWHVKLLDVSPDGRSINVATGFLRARWRDGFDEPRPVAPGKVVEYVVALRATAVRFEPGHRIRPGHHKQRLPELRPEPQHGRGRPAVLRTPSRAAATLVRRRAPIPARIARPHRG